MPSNILLLPFLAGFLFATFSNLRAYSTAQLPREHLLFHAAAFGLIFVVLSRAVCLLALATPPGLWFAELLHGAAPFPYIGTSLGAVLISITLIGLSNYLVPEPVAGHWLFNRGVVDPLTRLLMQSAIGAQPKPVPGAFWFTVRLSARYVGELWKLFGWRIFRTKWTLLRAALKDLRTNLVFQVAGFEAGQAKPVLLCMKDGRVIAGFVKDLVSNRPSAEAFAIVPVWTGFRDPSTNEIVRVTEYADALKRAEEPSNLSRVIRAVDISYATILDERAFEIPSRPPRLLGLRPMARRRVQTPRRKRQAGVK